MRALNFGRRSLSLIKQTRYPLIIWKQIVGFKTKKYETKDSNLNFLKYVGLFTIGGGLYFLANKYNNKNKALETSKEDDPILNIDMNEIYERTAVVFLSNPEVREVMGMPIKVTSSNEFDQIRSINLTREGKQVYALIAYDLQGPMNSGRVFCKLKMDSNTQKFRTESIICKLNKPDFQKRTEFIIKSNSK